MHKLILYTTDGCHLCEQAQQLLTYLSGQYEFELIAQDISVSEAMVERYGIRIPVIAKPGSTAELDWPFDYQQLESFLLIDAS